MNPFAINTISGELEIAAKYCRSQGIGIEVSDFAYPEYLDERLADRIERHCLVVAGITPLVSHGPFKDLIAASADSAIVEVTRNRHRAALQASISIGASYYVAHTNYNAFIRSPSYRQTFIRRTLDFWLPFADEAARRHVVICLENLWETGPELQAELIGTANHPNLKASFDNGHALVFSRKPAEVWIQTLGNNLAHCHLHDNTGETDDHLPVGAGKEDWRALIDAVRTAAPQAILVAESDLLASNIISYERLRSLVQV